MHQKCHINLQQEHLLLHPRTGRAHAADVSEQVSQVHDRQLTELKNDDRTLPRNRQILQVQHLYINPSGVLAHHVLVNIHEVVRQLG